MTNFLFEGKYAPLELGNIASMKFNEERKLIEENWTKTKLLEGLDGTMRSNMAVLFENTAQYLREQANTSTAGSFEQIAIPLVRRTFTKLLANDIVTVHALQYTTGKIFFYRPLISNRQADGSHTPYQGAYANQPVWSSSTTTTTPGQLGLNSFPDTPNFEPNLSQGPTLYDAYYSNSINPSQWGDSLFDRSRSSAIRRTSLLTPATTVPFTTGTTTYRVFVTGFTNSTQRGRIIGPNGVEVDTETFMSNLIVTCNTALTSPETSETLPAGTPINWSVVLRSWGTSPSALLDSNNRLQIELDLRVPSSNGLFTNPYPQITAGTIQGISAFTAVWFDYNPNEGDAEMADVTFDIEEYDITVGPARKMRATWTPELSMDVQRYQNVDAEAELTELMSETVSQEIDTEILKQLNSIAVWNDRWDYNGRLRPGSIATFQNQKDWNQTLLEKINQISAQIYKSTLESGADYLICSPEVIALFQNMEYFHMSDPRTEQTKYSMGIERVGTLNNRFVVYQNVKMPRGRIFIGKKSDTVMRTGFVYAPYQPVTLTPVMIDHRNFTNVRGLMTRYATKVINNRYYGYISITGIPSFGVGDLR